MYQAMLIDRIDDNIVTKLKSFWKGPSRNNQYDLFVIKDTAFKAINLISIERWVLTAAHCVTQLPGGFVFLINNDDIDDIDDNNNKGIRDAGSTADFRMLWSAMVCVGLL